jgi:hypothetical protein
MILMNVKMEQDELHDGVKEEEKKKRNRGVWRYTCTHVGIIAEDPRNIGTVSR